MTIEGDSQSELGGDATRFEHMREYLLPTQSTSRRCISPTNQDRQARKNAQRREPVDLATKMIM